MEGSTDVKNSKWQIDAVIFFFYKYVIYCRMQSGMIYWMGWQGQPEIFSTE